MENDGKKNKGGRVAALSVMGMVLCFTLIRGALLFAVPQGSRSDVIVIDKMSLFGPLKRSKVTFLHGKHTEALGKEKKNCVSCHIETDKGLSPKFKRVSDESAERVMDIYHSNCIGCHSETKKKRKLSGPVTCGGCHAKEPSHISSRISFGMDLSLHARHTRSLADKCETCHHEYDEPLKKLVYTKGKEGSCRYCHGEETVENRTSFREAAHSSCITCHIKRSEEKKSAGPSDCSGCHDAKEQQYIERALNIPRMEKKQPDVVLMRSFRKASDVKNADLSAKDFSPIRERMAPVMFNHKAHESYSRTCIACHHESLAACGNCHAVLPDEKGGYVSLEKAMHDPESLSSCIGCHAKEQGKKSCRGCHDDARMKSVPSDRNCSTCHMESLAEKSDGSHVAGEKELFEMASSRSLKAEVYDASDIPEKVIISGLSRDFEPVILPHRKIVETLVSGLSDSPLAKSFHRDPGTVCMGCHHQTPASKTPPRCGSCHKQGVDPDDLGRPGLLGAYHQQCMTCHEKMELKKPQSRNCEACHRKKV